MVMKRFFFRGVVASCLLFIVQNAQALKVGEQAPACPMRESKGGASIDLNKFRGKVVYLDYWASWCGPCLESMPFMDQLSKELSAKGLEVVPVNVDEVPEDASAFLKAHPISMAVVSDSTGECPSKYDVQVMPSSFLIDKKGVIRHVHKGFHSGDKSEIRSLVEKLLSEP